MAKPALTRMPALGAAPRRIRLHPHRRGHDRLCGLLVTMLLLVGCRAASHPLPPMPTTTPSPARANVLAPGDGDAVLATLIAAERAASISGDLVQLAALWAEDARIVDGRGTATPDDDLIWQGRAAILDRYQLAVFPAPPPALAVTDLDQATIQVKRAPDQTTADQASATLRYGGDRWQLIQRDGQWWLFELIYSTP